MKKFELISFPFFSDTKGETVPVELDENFPFPVKRVYFITGAKDTTRGGHAHTNEKELFLPVSGSVTAIVNDGNKDQKILLNKRNQGLYVGEQCWHEFKNFSPDCVVACFSSTHFEGRDGYIENKDVFLKSK